MAPSASAREELFITPRTVSHFTDQEVTDEMLREIYNLTKMGPTAFNSQPLRITWVRSAEAASAWLPTWSILTRQKPSPRP